MTAGLPGVGIGGVFYLLCAFMMPFAELMNTLRGHTSLKRWRTALTQFGLFCGIMTGFWLTGLFLGKLMVSSAKTGGESHSLLRGPNVFKIQPLFISLATLITVFAVLRISNYLWNRRSALSRKRSSKATAANKKFLP